MDEQTEFIEIGLWAAHQMYQSWGDVPAAGVIAGIGTVSHQTCMVIANDATVKAGAFFPQTAKKIIRAQKIAHRCRLPVIYLVDSAGVFLPLQDEIFPDEDDFGRIFRNNAVLSGAGIPQFAAIMGHCVAGGAYLPVLCDKVVMVEGSELYLAGPALVKAAIGQIADAQELGGAEMHATISGTVDFREPNDEACLDRIRRLVQLLPQPEVGPLPSPDTSFQTESPCEKIYDLIQDCTRSEYDVHDILKCFVDQGSVQEFKAEFGRALVTCYASFAGHPVGIVANQKIHTHSSNGEVQLGGVLYPEAVEKAARFIMDCNQTGLPLLFLQDVLGFMVGRDSEQEGIIRRGAKLVNVVSNSVVPKITLITGGSFGAGNYAMCGKAYDPTLIYAWPNAQYAVMGSSQAASTVLTIQQRIAERRGEKLNAEEIQQLHEKIKQQYEDQTDIRYGAARGWVDGILAPHQTRQFMIHTLSFLKRSNPPDPFRVGVLQV